MLRKLVLLIMSLLMAAFVFAEPEIIGITMVPAQPVFGQIVDVYVDMCTNNYNEAQIALAISQSPVRTTPGSGGQVFMVTKYGVNKEKITFLSSEDEIGYKDPNLVQL